MLLDMGKRQIGHIVAAFATFLVAVIAALSLSGCNTPPASPTPNWFDPAAVPAYSGEPSVELNGNQPVFDEADRQRSVFEDYSPLDEWGRCGAAYALIGRETMPNTPRESIEEVRPSGWHHDTYDWVDQRFLFNRCHLIGWQLAAENANERNLITGTRTMNTQGMLPYENEVASYVQRTGNHVLYRVTPVFGDGNLVASGVLMEAESVEDGGAGVCFCVWCYNVEPGVAIDYRTGESYPDGTIASGPARADEASSASKPTRGTHAFTVPGDEFRVDEAQADYILNAHTGKFHLPDCPSAADMREYNKFPFAGTREQLVELGFTPCGYCDP